MGETASFVQFPHPGREHRSLHDDMPWNTGPHGRKFLIAPGHYVADKGDDGDEYVGELVFWGEWEPPSRIERRWPAEGDLPRALHRPYWTWPGVAVPRQNTDPWVFGDHMLYSNCKQTRGEPPQPTAMQTLLPGSVICFGSAIGGRFCVDTVFVVATAHPWTPAQTAGLGVDEAFRVCTAESLTASTCGDEPADCAAAGCGGTHGAEGELTLYRGATVDNPVQGMYSFVPARPADDPQPRFTRPAVRLTERIEPASTQSARGANRPLPVDTVRAAWVSLRDQVLDHDLVLATALTTPPATPTSNPVPAMTRTRC